MPRNNAIKEGTKSAYCSGLLVLLYRLIETKAFRSLVRRLALRMEGGPLYSLTIRDIFSQFHGLSVGLYTQGPCEAEPERFVPGTTVGRYSSIYWTARALARDCLASTQFPDSLCCDSALGEMKTDSVACTGLAIGNDVFLGHNAIILPSVGQIGDGAFIGAGSVVHSTVPPYAVVTGNPARVVRYRFSERKIQELMESRWWLKSIDELSGEMEEFQRPLEHGLVR